MLMEQEVLWLNETGKMKTYTLRNVIRRESLGHQRAGTLQGPALHFCLDMLRSRNALL